MKYFWIPVLVAAIVFSLAACGKDKDIEVLDGDGMDAATRNGASAVAGGGSEDAGPGGGDAPADEAARVENERLSGTEPPEGWLLGEALSEDQLIYLFKHELYDEYPQDAPQLSVDINEDDTPEEKLASVKDLADRWEEAYEIGEVTIGGTFFYTFSSRSTGLLLIGTRDGMTLSVTIDPDLAIDDADVVAIINSIRVAAG